MIEFCSILKADVNVEAVKRFSQGALENLKLLFGGSNYFSQNNTEMGMVDLYVSPPLTLDRSQ